MAVKSLLFIKMPGKSCYEPQISSILTLWREIDILSYNSNILVGGALYAPPHEITPLNSPCQLGLRQNKSLKKCPKNALNNKVINISNVNSKKVML